MAKLLAEQLRTQHIGHSWHTIGQWTLARLKNAEVGAKLWRIALVGLGVSGFHDHMRDY